MNAQKAMTKRVLGFITTRGAYHLVKFRSMSNPARHLVLRDAAKLSPLTRTICLCSSVGVWDLRVATEKQCLQVVCAEIGGGDLGEVEMARIFPVRRDSVKDFDTVFEIAEAVMGFVPNSMLIMARDPDLLAAFAELSAVIVARPGRVDPGLKALIMYVVSRSAGCQYCAAHTANLAATRAIPVRKVEEVWQYETSAEFNDAERAALRFAQAAGQTPSAVTDADFADLRRHFDEDEILEIVATIALLGFLNRWNDTLATPLEAAPKDFAERHLMAAGWTLGKHAGAPVSGAVPQRAKSLKARLFLWLLKRWSPKPRQVGGV